MMTKNSQKVSVAFLYDDTIDNTDGVSQYVRRLGKWLTDNGHQVSYLVGESKMADWSGGKVYSLSKNLKLRWAGNNLSMPLWPRRKIIKRILDESKFDVVHVQMPYSPFMSKYVINHLPSNTALVGTFHVYPGSWLSKFGAKFLRLFYGQSLKRIDQVFCVSPAAAEYAKHSFKIDSQISPNIIDVKEFKTVHDTVNKSKNIVFLGRLVERKGCRQLLEAVAETNNKDGIELIIAGDGPQRKELESLSHKLGISDFTKFLGRIDESQKAPLLASADLACFPALYGESFGIVLIEAMASGSKMILAGDNPGYRSVLGEKSELLVDPNNKTLFARKMETLLEDNQHNHHLSSWLHKKVEQYDVNTVGAQMLNHYNSLIAKRQDSL